jgi:hypothetical protein
MTNDDFRYVLDDLVQLPINRSFAAFPNTLFKTLLIEVQNRDIVFARFIRDDLFDVVFRFEIAARPIRILPIPLFEPRPIDEREFGEFVLISELKMPRVIEDAEFPCPYARHIVFFNHKLCIFQWQRRQTTIRLFIELFSRQRSL